jgi:hypothetical protein
MIANGYEANITVRLQRQSDISGPDAGYRPCACRDCFETAIGGPGSYCHACDRAGCADYQGRRGMSQECRAEGAYGGDEGGGKRRSVAPSKRLALKAQHRKGLRPRGKNSGVIQRAMGYDRQHSKRPDWVVTKLVLTAAARRALKARGTLAHVAYPFSVTGKYRYSGETFHWQVPSVRNWRYDLTQAIIEPAAVPFLRRTRARSTYRGGKRRHAKAVKRPAKKSLRRSSRLGQLVADLNRLVR